MHTWWGNVVIISQNDCTEIIGLIFCKSGPKQFDFNYATLQLKTMGISGCELSILVLLSLTAIPCNLGVDLPPRP